MIAVAFLVLVGCAAVLYALTSRQRAVRVTVLAVASVGMWLLLERFAEVTP